MTFPGNMPAASEPGRPPAAAAPNTVMYAFYIYVGLALLSIISIILVVTNGDLDEAAQQAGQTNGVSAETLVNAVRITAVVIGVLIVALYLFFAFKMRAGRNWARIVLTVLSALSVISSFTTTASVTVNGQTYSSTTSTVVGWISTLATVIAVVLMFLAPSNAYFTSRRR